jgi:hypothetical protein
MSLITIPNREKQEALSQYGTKNFWVTLLVINYSLKQPSSAERFGQQQEAQKHIAHTASNFYNGAQIRQMTTQNIM